MAQWTDKDHLQWIYNRLAEVHGENKNADYMHRLKTIIDNTNDRVGAETIQVLLPGTIHKINCNITLKFDDD